MFATLGYLTCSTSSSKAFTWFSSLSTISGLIAWIIVFVTYLRFRKACEFHGISDTLPFKAPFQPSFSYAGIAMCFLITLTNGFTVFFHGEWDVSDFLTNYLSIAIVVVLYVAYKVCQPVLMLPAPYTADRCGIIDLSTRSHLETNRGN